MNTLKHGCTVALAALVLAVSMTPADAHPYGRGGYRGGSGPGWGAVGIGLGVGAGLGWLAGSRYAYGPPVYSSVIVPAYPSYVYVDPPVVYREVPPPAVYREVPRQDPVA